MDNTITKILLFFCAASTPLWAIDDEDMEGLSDEESECVEMTSPTIEDLRENYRSALQNLNVEDLSIEANLYPTIQNIIQVRLNLYNALIANTDHLTLEAKKNYFIVKETHPKDQMRAAYLATLLMDLYHLINTTLVKLNQNHPDLSLKTFLIQIFSLSPKGQSMCDVGGVQDYYRTIASILSHHNLIHTDDYDCLSSKITPNGMIFSRFIAGLRDETKNNPVSWSSSWSLNLMFRCIVATERDPNHMIMRDKCGSTLLQEIFENFDINIIKALSSSLYFETLSTLLEIDDPDRKAPLHYAFIKNQPTIIKVLGEAFGPDRFFELLKKSCKSNSTPFYDACIKGNTDSIKAAYASLGNEKFLELLQIKSMDMHMTALHYACKPNTDQTIFTLHQLLGVEQLFELLQCVTKFGHTPLHFACQLNQTLVIKAVHNVLGEEKFLKLMESIDNDGFTPLHFAFALHRNLNTIHAIHTLLRSNTFCTLLKTPDISHTPLHKANALTIQWLTDQCRNNTEFKAHLKLLVKEILKNNSLKSLYSETNTAITALLELLELIEDEDEDGCSEEQFSSNDDDSDDSDSPGNSTIRNKNSIPPSRNQSNSLTGITDTANRPAKANGNPESPSESAWGLFDHWRLNTNGFDNQALKLLISTISSF